MTNLPNPWLDLPAEKPYVLPCDRNAVDRFNVRSSERHRIHLEALPEPFIGLPGAPVVLLNLNPGFSTQDPMVHARQDVAALIRANLEHRTTGFYYFERAFDATPGGGWWRQRLGPVVNGASLQAVATRVLVVELFGYHSVGWKAGCNVPSQLYSIELVRSALGRDAIVVAMRARRQWEQLVPELADYGRLYSLNSVQNVTLSPRNCPAGWTEMMLALS